MSERLEHRSEKLQDSLDVSAESQRNLERLQEAAEQADKDPIQKHVESLQARAESHATSKKEAISTGEKSEQNHSYGITKELKNDTYARTLKKIRGNLSTSDKVLSKVVHQPVVEKVSNGLAKTVARPSAFLGGSMGALIGSAALVYMTRHYGFTYNYTAVFAAFAVGFVIALVIELVVRFIRRKAF